MKAPNRLCKECDTYYRDPGGQVGDPKRYCPNCGSWAWYWVNDGSDHEACYQCGTPVQLASRNQPYPVYCHAHSA